MPHTVERSRHPTQHRVQKRRPKSRNMLGGEHRLVPHEWAIKDPTHRGRGTKRKQTRY